MQDGDNTSSLLEKIAVSLSVDYSPADASGEIYFSVMDRYAVCIAAAEGDDTISVKTKPFDPVDEVDLGYMLANNEILARRGDPMFGFNPASLEYYTYFFLTLQDEDALSRLLEVIEATVALLKACEADHAAQQESAQIEDNPSASVPEERQWI